MATLGLLWNLEVTAWPFEPPPTRLPPTKFAMNFSFTIAECSADGLYHVARYRGVGGHPSRPLIDRHHSPGELGVDATGRTPYEDGRPARHDICRRCNPWLVLYQELSTLATPPSMSGGETYTVCARSGDKPHVLLRDQQRSLFCIKSREDANLYWETGVRFSY